MLYGVILTWLFWPPLAAYMFWRGAPLYGWVSIVSAPVITGMLIGLDQFDSDIPLFLSLFIHGIVASRLVAEAFRVAD